MRIKDVRMIQKYLKRNKQRSIWRKLLRMMACVVVFCTTYALILPVITLDRNYICGLEAHSHSDQCRSGPEAGTFLCDPEALGCHTHVPECFDPEGALLCDLSDWILHIHEEICYGPDGQLVCLLPEVSEHSHTEECFSDETLICSLPEVTEHSHTEECFSDETLVCSLPEVTEHRHTEECFSEKALVCGLPEVTEHRHSEDCLDETGTRICGLPETLTHQHNENCPVLEEPQWICGIPEHTHDDSCVEVQQVFNLQARAAAATLNLNFTSYSEWNPINFPNGNTYSIITFFKLNI